MKDAFRMTAPHILAYVISQDRAGRVNAMGLSWWTFVSNHPPTLLICLSRSKHTIRNIEQTRQFSLCIPDESLRGQAKKICSSSGAEVDKIAQFGVELAPARKISVPVLKKSCACFECSVQNIVDAGDHAICIAEILDYVVNDGYHPLRTLESGYVL